MTYPTIEELRDLVQSGREFALLDVRERGLYGLGHLLCSTHSPFSELELRIAYLVPRAETLIVLVDGGHGIIEQAARALERQGYTNVLLNTATVEDWKKNGLEVFVGDDPLPKGFGELVEIARHTPNIDVADLHAMFNRNEPYVLIDGRSDAEFSSQSIPSALNLPNGELLWRIGEVVKDDSIPVIVSCAGRTRSIIGAQTLIDAGIANPVFALRGGTQAWRMAGFSLVSGRDPVLPEVSVETAKQATDFAETLRRRLPVPGVSSRRALEAEIGQGRTIYFIDIRTRSEYEAGHVKGAIHVAGGQLTQTITRWCAVRSAVVVLVEGGNGVRALTVAYWLRQMGWDCRVLEGEEAQDEIADPTQLARDALLPRCTFNDLQKAVSSSNLLLLDVGSGMGYRKAHLPGAQWVIRPNLENHAAAIGKASRIIVYGESDLKAELVGQDVARLAPGADVAVFPGGLRSWLAGGGQTQSSPAIPTDEDCLDYLFWTHDRLAGNDEASAEYFRWELGLPEQLERDATAKFSIVTS